MQIITLGIEDKIIYNRLIHTSSNINYTNMQYHYYYANYDLFHATRSGNFLNSSYQQGK